MEKSILMRIVSNIPIVGTALAMWIEYTEMGVEQYGAFLGLLRGLVVGFGVAITVISLSKGAIAIFDVSRFWVQVHVTSRYKAEIGTEASRQAAEEANRPYYERHKNEAPWVAQKKETATCQEMPIGPCFRLKLGKYEKLHYVRGIHDAISSNHGLWSYLFRTEWTFGEEIERLDKFYANGAHADIPVIDALRKVRGR